MTTVIVFLAGWMAIACVVLVAYGTVCTLRTEYRAWQVRRLMEAYRRKVRAEMDADEAAMRWPVRR